MGRRSNTATVAAVFQAFLHRPRWRQAELARRVGVGVRALRKHLMELSEGGVPLTSDSECDPPHVYWQVPKDWFPDGVVFDSECVSELLRVLIRLPRSQTRDKLIGKILETGPQPSIAPPPDVRPVIAPQSTKNEQRYLSLVEDAATRRICLEFDYFSTSRGDLRQRSASVQQVMVGPPARFVAVCHLDGSPKWFRVDQMQSARLKPSEPFRAAEPGQVDTMLNESVDGFHHGAPVECSFVVSEPESRWVEHNLPVSMSHKRVPGGLRFTTTTAGVLRLARFVVGLGPAARAETPELAERVQNLARGALERSSGGSDPPANSP